METKAENAKIIISKKFEFTKGRDLTETQGCNGR